MRKTCTYVCVCVKFRDYILYDMYIFYLCTPNCQHLTFTHPLNVSTAYSVPVSVHHSVTISVPEFFYLFIIFSIHF